MSQHYRFEPAGLFENVIRPKLPEGAVIKGFCNAGPMIQVDFYISDDRCGCALFSDYGNLWGINWWASPAPWWNK